ncbi:MAG TPA: hypothetical protein VGK32_12625 [Vicinamibacterales bacterium]|jgi:hypothetical protein
MATNLEPGELLIERIYCFAEAREVDKAVFACLRLARENTDTFNVIVFLREAYPDRTQMQSAFQAETLHLNQEARRDIWKATQDRWIEERTVSPELVGGEEGRSVLAMGVGEMERDIEQMEAGIRDLALPPGLGEYDAAAFTDRNLQLKGQMRLKIRACQQVLERVRTRCVYYATRVQAQIAAEARTSDLVGEVQREVHNFYAERCDLAYQSLRKAASLIGSTDPEDHALLLTSVRRAMKAVADYHYPPVQAPVSCSDGNARLLGEEQYLNRLQEFCARNAGAGSSGSLLRTELEHLTLFMRRLNDVASKGVHAQVSASEARQGLLGVYMFLCNLIARLSAPANVQQPGD